ncbi:MAG: hypothetical protein ABFD64_12775 [Armatimonadota bacterium]
MRSNVPFLGTPVGYTLTWAVMSIASATIWLAEPTMRPGVIECLIALVYGIPAGLLLGKVWVWFLSCLVDEVPSNPHLKWFAHLVYPMSPIGPQTAFRLATLAVMASGLAFIFLVLRVLTPKMTGLSAPWICLNVRSAWEDMAATFIPYFLSWLASLTIVGVRWYNSLED